MNLKWKRSSLQILEPRPSSGYFGRIFSQPLTSSDVNKSPSGNWQLSDSFVHERKPRAARPKSFGGPLGRNKSDSDVVKMQNRKR